MDSHLNHINSMMEGPVVPSDELNEYNDSWDWPVAESFQQHAERVALLRPIPYELLYDLDMSLEPQSPELRIASRGKGLSLNVSSGGMLMVMDHPPKVNQAIKVHVPTPVTAARTPTLAEVRWTRKLPFQMFDSIYFVGLKFVLANA